MKKSVFLALIPLWMGLSCLPAQDTLFKGKALNFPARKYGISIGNSVVFNGFRFNFADQNVKKINGINLTLWFRRMKNQTAVVNGISIGVLPLAGTMQPINLGLLGTGADKLNGLSVGGIVIGSGGHINGISISGLIIAADGPNSALSGISLAGLGLGAEKVVNGLALGGLLVNSGGDINGIACSLAFINCEKIFRGIAVAPGFLDAKSYKGLAFAGYAKTERMQGLSFALFNWSGELHGLQIGVLNYAGNNSKGYRMLPLINMHLGKS
jgi:hypothetical protein